MNIKRIGKMILIVVGILIVLFIVAIKLERIVTAFPYCGSECQCYGFKVEVPFSCGSTEASPYYFSIIDCFPETHCIGVAVEN